MPPPRPTRRAPRVVGRFGSTPERSGRSDRGSTQHRWFRASWPRRRRRSRCDGGRTRTRAGGFQRSRDSLSTRRSGATRCGATSRYRVARGISILLASPGLVVWRRGSRASGMLRGGPFEVETEFTRRFVDRACPDDGCPDQQKTAGSGRSVNHRATDQRTTISWRDRAVRR